MIDSSCGSAVCFVVISSSETGVSYSKFAIKRLIKDCYSGEISNSNIFPSCLKNSCTGNDCSHECYDFHFAAEFQSEDDAMSEGPKNHVKSSTHS